MSSTMARTIAGVLYTIVLAPMTIVLVFGFGVVGLFCVIRQYIGEIIIILLACSIWAWLMLTALDTWYY